MNVYIARDVRTDEWLVLGRERAAGGPAFAMEADGKGHLSLRAVKEGEAITPLLALPGDMAREFFSLLANELAANGFRPSEASDIPIAAHLKDAVAVRDRLFALVESLTSPDRKA